MIRIEAPRKNPTTTAPASPARPFRLQRIPSIARRQLPAIVIGDESVLVDSVGLVVIGRQWPIRGVPSPTEVGLAGEWLSDAQAVKLPRPNSYMIKHIIERGCGRYVSNGAAILAAFLLGFNLSQARTDSPNARVGIAMGWLRNQPESAAVGLYRQRRQARSGGGPIIGADGPNARGEG